MQAGGNVVRFVGLYHAQRGAHTYFLRVRDVQRPGNSVVNLLHYEDAARLAVSVSDGALLGGRWIGLAWLSAGSSPSRLWKTACVVVCKHGWVL